MVLTAAAAIALSPFEAGGPAGSSRGETFSQSTAETIVREVDIGGLASGGPRAQAPRVLGWESPMANYLPSEWHFRRRMGLGLGQTS